MSGTWVWTKKRRERLKKHNKKLWTAKRRREQSERIRDINLVRKDSPETRAKKSAGVRNFLMNTPKGAKVRKASSIRRKLFNSSPKERNRRSELMKKRHREGTTGLPKAGGFKRYVSPLPRRIKDKSKNHMSPEARARAAEHMRRVNREILTPEKRAEMGRKQSQTIRNRPFTVVEHPSGPGGPNKMEAQLLELIRPLGFRYVGDGRFWIGPCLSRKCRNPDFVFGSGKNKTAILFHGTYWHKRADSDDNEEKKDYRKAGWNLLIVWEKELRNPSKLTNKVSRWLASLGFFKMGKQRSTT